MGVDIKNIKPMDSNEITINEYEENDIAEMLKLWNEIVEGGIAFPQEDCLDEEAAKKFFGSQTYTGVAKKDGKLAGLYILHPNNVGRCGHIANASYAVMPGLRGMHIGEALVKDSMKKAKEKGFSVLMFNAVVESNIHARHLYERLGFVQLGVIPEGFKMKDGSYENICPYYRTL